MRRSRPRRAARPPLTVRIGRIAAPALLAGLATAGVITAAADPGSPQALAVPVTAPAPVGSPSPTASGLRDWSISRGSSGVRRVLPSPSAAAKSKPKPVKQSRHEVQSPKKAQPPKRVQPPKKVQPQKAKAPSRVVVVGRRYTRVDLNVRAQDDAGSRLLTVLKTGSTLSVTATVRGEWRYISYRGAGAWVKDQYLTRDKPAVATSGISSAACASGSAVEAGLTRDAVRVHRAICARYPSVGAYGGVRADSLPEHPSGRALDAMISDSGVGWQIAKWVRANAKQLGVSEILYARHIWTVQRSGEGWRSFADRGSATANHDDHVHVSVYGNAGSQ